MQSSSLDWIYGRLAASFDRWLNIDRTPENVRELAAARIDLEDHRTMARRLTSKRPVEPEVVRKFDVDDEYIKRLQFGRYSRAPDPPRR